MRPKSSLRTPEQRAGARALTALALAHPKPRPRAAPRRAPDAGNRLSQEQLADPDTYAMAMAGEAVHGSECEDWDGES